MTGQVPRLRFLIGLIGRDWQLVCEDDPGMWMLQATLWRSRTLHWVDPPTSSGLSWDSSRTCLLCYQVKGSCCWNKSCNGKYIRPGCFMLWNLLRTPLCFCFSNPLIHSRKLAIELILRTLSCLSVDSSQILYIRLHLRDLCERQSLHRECLLHRKHVAEVSQKTQRQGSNRSETQQNLPRKKGVREPKGFPALHKSQARFCESTIATMPVLLNFHWKGGTL